MRKRALSQAGLGSSNRASQPSSAELILQYTVQCMPQTPRPPPGPLFLPISPTSTSSLSSFPRSSRWRPPPSRAEAPRAGTLFLSPADEKHHDLLQAARADAGDLSSSRPPSPLTGSAQRARGGAQRRWRRRTEATPGGGPGRAAAAALSPAPAPETSPNFLGTRLLFLFYLGAFVQKFGLVYYFKFLDQSQPIWATKQSMS
jgi:hypothetical protein